MDIILYTYEAEAADGPAEPAARAEADNDAVGEAA
jgi:hypothetical protein